MDIAFSRGCLMINKRKISFIVIIVLFLILLYLNLYYFTFSRNRSGDEYKINWRSDKYDITFTSLDEHFPYISNFYDGKVLLNKKYIDLTVFVDDSEISFGFFGEPYTEYIGSADEPYDTSDFKPAVSGNFTYDGVSFIVSVNKIYDKRFDFLNDKTIVFFKN